MRFIDKDNPEYRVKGLKINRQILDAQWVGSHYVNLEYSIVDKSELIDILVQEQEERCCYCMRRLHLQDHRKNVTLEHVIPNKITPEEWERDKVKYRKFTKLSDRNVTVCPGGKLINASTKFGMPPFPHFLSYDNLAASCDGRTLNQDGQEIAHHCCNNKRGNNYVEPLYFHSNVSEEISYDSRGHIVCDEEYEPYLNEDTGVNIMCKFLNDVRLFWKKVADSEYTSQQIHEAVNNQGLRIDIIDDIFTNDPTGHWLFLTQQHAWSLFSDYDWFYSYYHNKIT